MIELHILTGAKAGTTTGARFFPVEIGRSPACQVPLDGAGVFDRHAMISIEPGAGFVLQAAPNALLSVNGQTGSEFRLRSGDTLGFGSVSARFSLSPPAQRGLRAREALTWFGLALLSLGQVALVYWLLQ